MIRITDRTLSCCDDMTDYTSVLSRFLVFLIKMEVDGIELSEKMYHVLRPLPEYPSYVLRIQRAEDMKKYPNITRFICRNSPSGMYGKVRSEVILNDIRESYTIAKYSDCPGIRIQGLDNLMSGDYIKTFSYLKKAFRGDIELCPSNRFHCSSAIAAEWLMSDFGKDIVTSFGGLGGFAPTEEIVMILRVKRLRKIGKTYDFFPEMSDLFQTITGQSVHKNKPVIGRDIFAVESGIHVDGIMKQPKCYEPFPPDTVGQTRKIVLGKHSGKSSVRTKLTALDLECEDELISIILNLVKEASIEKNGALTDSEFVEIVKGV